MHDSFSSLKRAAFAVGALLVVGLAAPGGVPAAHAQDQKAQDQNKALKAKRGGAMPYARVKKIAENAGPGRVVGQQLLEGRNGSWIYRMTVLREDGRAVRILIDARTGRILSGGR